MDAKQIFDLKEHYKNQSKKERKVWVDCYKNYINHSNPITNPYLSNLFIPKTHEAVELLTAFLVGKNQSIEVSPEGPGDTESSSYMKQLLDWQWRKVLYARAKLLVFIKQGILFGNGYMKVGWNFNGKTDEPFMSVIGIDNIFTDYYNPEVQDGCIIHRIIKPISEIQKDERYKKTRNLTPIGESEIEESDNKFSSFDNTNISSDYSAGNKDNTEILEYWELDKVTTVGHTSFGDKILREIDNPYIDADGSPYIPFVKFKFKNSPLPNRAYDTGGIEPTLEIQKAYNLIVNEFFDNVSLINNKQWIKKRSANIDPKSLIRRPGGIIEVNDINQDIRSEETSDIKQSLIEMIRYLDNEFQQSSMVVNLIKGIGGDGTATEASLEQQNTQTMLDMIDGNIKESFSRIGMMLADLNIQYQNKTQTIKLFDNDREMGFANIRPQDIKGKYDISISSDRGATEGKAVKQKQLLDFLSIISNDQMIIQKYPDITSKIYKMWLKEGGFNDIDYLFEDNQDEQQLSNPLNNQAGGRQFSMNTGLTDEYQIGMSMQPPTAI